MEINIKDYLSEEDIAEICREEVKNIIRQTTDKDIARLIGNAAYYKVYDTIDDLLPKNYESELLEKVEEIIDSLSRTQVIRYHYLTDKPTSAGAEIVERTVKEREKDIINKVNQAIDKKLSQSDDDLYSEFVERFMDGMYSGFDISFKAKKEASND